MAKYIIDGKIYDTDNAEVFFEFENDDKCITIYKTKSGRWFSVYNYKDFSEKYANLERKSTVKDAIGRLNDIELYEKLFGKLKEA